MNRILAPLGLYWYVLLDLILTHVYVIAFLMSGHELIAAVLMAFDSLVKSTLAIPLARWIVPLPPSTRGKLCTLIRFTLVFVWYVSVSQLPFNSFSYTLIIPFLIFKLLFSIDSSLGVEFIFSLQEIFHVNLSQSAAAMNILSRSGTAIAPAVALVLLTTHHAATAITLVALSLAFLSTHFLKKILFSSNQPQHIHQAHTPFFTLVMNPLIRWSLLWQLLVNFAFSGVAFLLLTKLKLHGSIFFNDITLLYTSFFIIQCIVLMWGDSLTPGKKPLDMVWMILLCASLVLIAGLCGNTARLAACTLIGIFYSLTLASGQKIITSRLKGNGFLEYTSWAQMIGRSVSFFSTTALGFALNNGLSSSALLILCGCAGILSGITLAYYAPKIAQDDITHPSTILEI